MFGFNFWKKGIAAGFLLSGFLFATDLLFLVKNYSGICGDTLSPDAKTYPCSLFQYILNDPYYGLYGGVNAKLTLETYIIAFIAPFLIFLALELWKRRSFLKVKNPG